MKLTNLILSLLGGVIIYCCSNNEADAKTDTIEIQNLDTSNKKSVFRVDSTKVNSEINNLDEAFISRIYSTVSDPLDLLLFCGEYNYFPNQNPSAKSYFEVPYNGCVYNPKYHPNNKLGWAQIILIPKSESERRFSNITKPDKIDSIEKVVNDMNVSQLKTNFIPLIFLIDTKYLVYKDNAEINFYPELPYVKKLIIYKNESKKWISIDSIKVRNEAADDDWINKVMHKFNIR